LHVDLPPDPARRRAVVRSFNLNTAKATSPEARVIIETRPGEECQVDYGTGPMVRDPDSGKYRRTRLFVLTLGCSRKCIRLLVFKSSTRVWADLHEKAFRRLGGSTLVVVLDNLREGEPRGPFHWARGLVLLRPFHRQPNRNLFRALQFKKRCELHQPSPGFLQSES
jgi:hypothetical protein